MPLVNKPFGDIITFTRASTGSYFDATGTLQSAAINSPRFDYNPTTLAPQGFLIEEARTNSIRNNTMVGAVVGGALPTNWSVFTALTGLTREVVGTGTENGITYIDLRVSGTPSGAGTYGFYTETPTGVAALNGQTWTNSGYFKLQAGSLTGVTSVRLYFQENNSGGSYLSEQNPAITNPTSAALNTQRASASRTLNQATTAFLAPGFNLLLTGAAIDITLRIGLPQLELGAFATSVIPTAPVFVSRASTGTYFDSAGVLQSAAINVARNNYNPASLSSPPILLLEAAATNLMLYSEQFDNVWWTKTRSSITANATTAPTGTAVADKLVEDTTASASHPLSSTTVTITGTTVHSFSVFAKAAERSAVVLRINAGADGIWGSFNLSTGAIGTAANSGTGSGATLSIQNVGSGWYRCTLTGIFSTSSTTPNAIIYPAVSTADPTNTSIIYTGDGTSGIFVFGAQLEAGSIPTSYIPTTTTALTRSADVFTQAAVTRSADVASVNTVSPWFNAAQGTLYVEAQHMAPSAAVQQFQAQLASGSGDYYGIYKDSSPANTTTRVRSGGSDQVFAYTTGAIVANTTYKTALGYAVNDFASCSNGGTVFTDTAGALPTSITALGLGQATYTSSVQLNGYLRRVTYYPRRLSNDEIRSLTLPTGAVISTQDYTLDTNFTGNTVAIGS